jgi:superfamily I DNA and RNA helicase
MEIISRLLMEKDLVYRGYLGFPYFRYNSKSITLEGIFITIYGVLGIIEKGQNSTDENDAYIKIESILKSTPGLLNRRELIIPYDVYVLNSEENIESRTFSSEEKILEYFLIHHTRKIDDITLRLAVNAIEGCMPTSKIEREESGITRIISSLEEHIANYDISQLQCLIDGDESIQAISGLAGSGKTIVLAKKASEIILSHPDEKICITFFSRALKGTFFNLLKQFLSRNIDNFDELMKKIDIINAWGDSSGDGFYSSMCKDLNIEAIPFYLARQKSSDPFYYVCKKLFLDIEENKTSCNKYDFIYVDEAQDTNEFFLKLCQIRLNEFGKLTYAYDEFQDLNSNTMKLAEDIFGKDVKTKSTPLSVCYRTPKEILVTAHAIGMGIKAPRICQFFDDLRIWKTIGYNIIEGGVAGQKTRIRRESPSHFDLLSNFEFIVHQEFDNIENLATSMVKSISDDLQSGLRPKDIMIIDLARWETEGDYLLFREKAMGQLKVNMAGYSNSNIFWEDDKIIYSYVHRAKGNEAYKVYIVNSQLSMTANMLDIWRNRLFTAMTRSKLQVVLLSLSGTQCEQLKREINQIRLDKFDLVFTYPTDKEIKQSKAIARQNIKKEEDVSNIGRLIDVIKKGKLSKEEQIKELSGALKSKYDEETIRALIESLDKK